MSGTIESVWRYPVKSMQGEAVENVFVSFSGLIGDRVYAIHSDSRAERFPWFTGRQYPDLIRHNALYRNREMTHAPNNPDASHPNLPEDSAFEIDIETPEGIRRSFDELFLAELPSKEGETLSAVYSPRNFADVAPVSLISLQTAAQLSEEMGMDVDKRRFRMNFYINWDQPGGFQEDSLVGKNLQIGNTVEIAIRERDARCKMITLDPDTGAGSPEFLKHVLNAHDGCAGVYASVLREGMVKPGDAVVVF